MEEYPTPPQAWGLLSGTNVTVPVRQELKDNGLNPPKIIVSRATAHFGPTKRISGSPNPSRACSALPDLSGVGLVSSDLLSEGFTSPDPRGRVCS
jgi:hypothetical protein